MNANIKAIETEYAGYRFRSRLEARWAVFMDTLDIKYEYEKEGFDLNGTWYLPDFWLPEQQRWIEIKGQKATKEEQEKAKLLALQTEKPAFILAGNIGLNQEGYPEYDCWMHFPGNRVDRFPDDRYIRRGTWKECRRCYKIGLNPTFGQMEWQDLPWLFCQCHEEFKEPDCNILMWYNPIRYNDDPTDKIIEAFKTARHARFEHGETPTR